MRVLNLLAQIKPQKSPADLADLRRQNTNSKTTITAIISQPSPTCLSLRNNAACCIPLRDLRNLRENNTQEYSINLQTCSIISARTPHYLHLDTAFFSRTRAHRVFQKYQCRSVYTLNIRMLHPLSSLFKCHHCAVCRNAISARFIPAIFV